MTPLHCAVIGKAHPVVTYLVSRLHMQVNSSDGMSSSSWPSLSFVV
jgi:hypothetical protein